MVIVTILESCYCCGFSLANAPFTGHDIYNLQMRQISFMMVAILLSVQRQ
jgi:hypothetical protein